MKVYNLPQLDEWDHFDSFAETLQRLGWNVTQRVDGPDARSWAFTRSGTCIWLVFDDMLGGSLKSEDPSVSLEEVADQLGRES